MQLAEVFAFHVCAERPLGQSGEVFRVVINALKRNESPIQITRSTTISAVALGSERGCEIFYLYWALVD
jgi:hypothetical protein